jgi:glycosyltransferase involved in cell wall biosynthesis
MSYGLPVLATKVGDVPDAVEDGVNGFLFEPGDADALADGIRRIADRDVWEKMSEQSRKLAEEKFNEDGFFGSLLALWKDAEGRKA